LGSERFELAKMYKGEEILESSLLPELRVGLKEVF